MISIIIPTYNRFLLLNQAVESCLNQSYQDIEIIIVDDGSTDATEERVKELLKSEWSDKLIFYFKQQNSGASAARNLGVEKAQGKYVQFLDSDDLLYPNKLELQLEEITKHKADVCSCYGFMGAIFGAEDNEILGASFENKIDLMHKMCSGSVHIMQTTAPLWRKSFLDSTKGWNTSIAFGDDLEYHIRLLTKVSKICFIPEKLFFVREHADFRLSDAKGNLRQIESGIKAQQCITEIIIETGIWDKLFQDGILKNSRMLYLNYLKLADKSKVKIFEKWLSNIAKKPKKKIFILIVIFFRRIFGAKLLLNVYDFSVIMLGFKNRMLKVIR